MVLKDGAAAYAECPNCHAKLDFNSVITIDETTHKQVIVMRKDLNMRKGKMIAQGAHASLKALLQAGGPVAVLQGHDYWRIPLDDHIGPWLEGMFKKVCVGVDSEEELFTIYAKARVANIPCAMITDSGLTEFGGIPTNTCIAVGPAHEDIVDTFTGHLKLL